MLHAIFVSTCRNDLGHARQLHDRLRLWFDEAALFFGSSSTEPGAGYAEQIAEMLRAARAVLVLIGPQWLAARNRCATLTEPDPVRMEIEWALRRPQEASAPRVIPVLLGNAQRIALNELHESLRAGLGPLFDLPLHELLDDQDWDQRFVVLRNLLAEVAGVPAPLFHAPDGEWQLFPRFERPVSVHFHDPRGQLAELRAALVAHGVVAMVAGAGMGKTQLAMKYCLDYQDAYAEVWWLRTYGAGALELDETRARALAGISLEHRLQRQPRCSLLVCDAAETYESLLPYLSASPHHVLITSSAAVWSGIPGRIELVPWSVEEGADFLAARSPDARRCDLQRLSRLLGGLPLALERALQWLHGSGGCLTQYCDSIEAVDTSAVTLSAGRAATAEERIMFAMLSVAWERMSQPARRLLRLCTWFGPDPIPERYFLEGRAYLPSPLNAVAAQLQGWRKTLGELQALGMVECVATVSLHGTSCEPQPATEPALLLDRLTLEVARHVISIPKEDGPVAQQLLYAACPVDPEEQRCWPRFVTLLPHLRSLDSFRPCDWLQRQPQVRMLERAAHYLAAGPSAFVEAAQLFQRCVDMRCADLGEEHPETLNTMMQRAVVLRAQGDLSEARQLQEKVLTVQRRVLGKEHPDTLTSMLELARIIWSNRWLADLRAAHEILERLLPIRRRVSGDEHPDTLTCMDDLAATSWALLRYSTTPLEAQVEQLDAQVLAGRRRVLGEEHPATLTCLGRRANTLAGKGDLEAAARLQAQVLTIRRRLQGDDHPDTIACAAALSSVHWQQGNFAEARQLDEFVLAMYRRSLGPHHLKTWRAMQGLADGLRRMGLLDQAIPVMTELVQRLQASLGPEHRRAQRLAAELDTLLLEAQQAADSSSR